MKRTICWTCLEFAGQAAHDKLNAPGPDRWVFVSADGYAECNFCWLFVRIGE